jgi:hypothetical protein
VIRLGEEAAGWGFDRVVEMRQRKHPDHAAVTVWILVRQAGGKGSGGASAAEAAGGWPS